MTGHRIDVSLRCGADPERGDRPRFEFGPTSIGDEGGWKVATYGFTLKLLEGSLRRYPKHHLALSSSQPRITIGVIGHIGRTDRRMGDLGREFADAKIEIATDHDHLLHQMESVPPRVKSWLSTVGRNGRIIWSDGVGRHMILSDRDIKKRLEEGSLVIDPLDDPELQIQPASVDLRLGGEFLEFRQSNIPYINPDSPAQVEDYTQRTIVEDVEIIGQTTLDSGTNVEHYNTDKFILHPGDFVLGTTKERVEIPDDLIAHVEGRSSLGRLAIVVHASLPYDEQVFLWTPTEGFGFYPIGHIVEEERPARAVAFDPRTLDVRTFPVTDYITNPTKRIYRVTLQSGREVTVTKDHNLFTIDEHGGIIRLPSEEAEGELVLVPGTLPDPRGEERTIDLVNLFGGDDEVIAYASDGFGEVTWQDNIPLVSQRQYSERGAAPLSCVTPTDTPADTEVAFKQSDEKLPRYLDVSPEFGWVLGFYIAAGSCKRNQIQFSNTNEDYLDRVEAYFDRYETSLYRRDSGRIERLTVSSALWEKLFGRLAGTGSEKNIPWRAWNWNNEVLSALLQGLIDGDGHRRSERDTLHTSNEDLADRTQYLATRLGYLSTVYSRERSQYIEMSDTYNTCTMWSVDIQKSAHKRGQYLPVPSGLLKQYRDTVGLTMAEAAEHMGYSSKSSIAKLENKEYDSVKRDTLRRIRDAYREAGADTTRLNQLLNNEVRFDKVVSVEATNRVEPTYDLEVQPQGRTIENFIGGRGGVFLSNTAGLCDPGYRGQITLELSNLGTAPVSLRPGMRVSQLTFTELSSPAERPYGSDRGSKYQDQQGPQASRIEKDEEFGGDQLG